MKNTACFLFLLCLPEACYPAGKPRGQITQAVTTAFRHSPLFKELVVIIQVPRDSWKMSITGFCSAETLDFCWRDDIGKEQLEGFTDQVA
jgi:hypothetical protein